MFLYEITFWSRTANSEKHTANENSGLTTIGVSNNLWEVGTQGFDGIDAKNINFPNELCNITRMLDCNSEKKRKKPWRLILLVKDALTSYLTDQGRFDVLSYCSRTLWSLILLVKDALTSYLIDEGRFEVLSYWSRTLWSLTLLIKDALKFLVLWRFNCVSIVMPCILVRSSMKMEDFSKSVPEDASLGVVTSIDYSPGKGTNVSATISAELQSLNEVTSNGFMSRWHTMMPPFVVLAKLQDLGFLVVAANTVGETTVWTLQGNLNVRR